MDGNLAPLHLISKLCKSHEAVLIVDDAHGTGVLGKGGSGTASHLGCADQIDLCMGTFSKVFAVSGGFLTGSADLINYLRFHARPYIFSASIPPPITAAVLAGLEVIEKEPWLRTQSLQNVSYAVQKLEQFGFCAKPEAAIIALKLPEGMNIRAASLLFHRKGIFINPIEFPAVPANRERFRISQHRYIGFTGNVGVLYLKHTHQRRSEDAPNNSPAPTLLQGNTFYQSELRPLHTGKISAV
jgi:glycine C-acetyltransferase